MASVKVTEDEIRVSVDSSPITVDDKSSETLVETNDDLGHAKPGPGHAIEQDSDNDFNVLYKHGLRLDSAGNLGTDDSYSHSWSSEQTFEGRVYHQDIINLSSLSGPSLIEGDLYYDSDDKALTFRNDISDSSLNIGYEQWTRVYNNSGSTISNGDVVYITGFHSNSSLPMVDLAKADSKSTAQVAGIATHDISNNSEGLITSFGTVRGLDLSSFNNGEKVWLSPSTAGTLTNTEPSPPDFSVLVGKVSRATQGDGRLLTGLQPQTTADFQSGSVPFGGSSGQLIEDNKNLNYDDSADKLYASTIKLGGDPSNSKQAATKSYVDSTANGLDWKDSVRAGPTSDIDLSSTSDPNPVDGVTLSDGDRVLLHHQNKAYENGIYDAVDATDPSTWSRSSDADEDSDVTSGMTVWVEEGTDHGDEGFILTTDDPITVGSTDLSFTNFSTTALEAGSGLSKSGNTLDVNTDFGVTVTSDDVEVYAQDLAGNLLTTSGSPAVLDVDESNISHDNIADVSTSDHHVRPTAGEALTDTSDTFDVAYDFGLTINSGDLEVVEGDISHDNISGVSSSDHHVRPSAGEALQDVSDTFDVLYDHGLTIGSSDLEVAPSDFAGSHLTTSGTPTVLDVKDDFVLNTGDTMSGDLDMGGGTNNAYIQNLHDPVNPQDAATKNYVDSQNSMTSWSLEDEGATTKTINDSDKVIVDGQGVTSSLSGAGPYTMSVDVQAGTGLSVSDDSLDVDETTSFTWTGTHGFKDATLELPYGASLAPTGEGVIGWDSDDDKLYVGNGQYSHEVFTPADPGGDGMTEEGKSLGTDGETFSARDGRFNLIVGELQADTTSTASADVELHVDPDGDGTYEYVEQHVKDAGSSNEKKLISLILPPDGQIKYVENTDSGGNSTFTFYYTVL